jgi:hypothetical protein
MIKKQRKSYSVMLKTRVVLYAEQKVIEKRLGNLTLMKALSE